MTAPRFSVVIGPYTVVAGYERPSGKLDARSDPFVFVSKTGDAYSEQWIAPEFARLLAAAIQAGADYAARLAEQAKREGEAEP